MTYRLACLVVMSILGSFVNSLSIAAQAQTAPTRSSVDLENQIKALQQQLKEQKEKEALEAIAEEVTARRKADDARAYLASIGKPVLASQAIESRSDTIAAASTAAKDKAVTTTITDKPDGSKEVKVSPTNGRDLTSFVNNLTVGAAVFFHGNPHVETAEFVGSDRRVIIRDKRSHSVSPWLQANWVIEDCNPDQRRIPLCSDYVKPGLFVGVGSGSNGSFLNTFGFGGQLSFRRSLITKTSLNLGLGYYVSTIKRLADGITAGEPLPAEFDQVKYVNKSVGGPMINLSFGFQ